jgi:RNA polymerase sigma factor for flagellar operon FliA
VYDQYSIWYASEEDSPEEKLSNEELKQLLKTALHSLSEREKLVIQLYYVEELNVFEIAEVMEISTGRVSQIKKSAIANLRSFITKAQDLG